MSVKLAPSILSADFGRLADEVGAAETAGADWIHVDVMDGHFVPNITIGPAITRAVRRATTLPVDVHLMIEAPDRYLEAFVDAGADLISVHQEACTHLHRTIERIHDLGAAAGVALNPATPVDSLHEILPDLDLVVVMSVNPGFGGQRYIPSSTAKIRGIRDAMDERGKEGADLEVDGGVTAETAAEAVAAGATVLVAGSAVYRHPGGVAEGLGDLRRVGEKGGREGPGEGAGERAAAGPVVGEG